MGGAGSGRHKTKIELPKMIRLRGLNKEQTRRANLADMKEKFFKALDEYMVEYNQQQIANSNRLYQFVMDRIELTEGRFLCWYKEYKRVFGSKNGA